MRKRTKKKGRGGRDDGGREGRKEGRKEKKEGRKERKEGRVAERGG